MSSHDPPPSAPSHQRPRRGNALAVIALLLALAALAVSTWTAFRPARGPAATPEFSAAQQTDAKVATCAAADIVRRGVSTNTNLQSPGGDGDVTGSLAVAANARLSLSSGGLYLLARVGPATPVELAAAVTQFANTLMDIGASATAGALNTDPDQVTRLRDADAANSRIAALCG